jgi:serine/threonine protein kinase
MLGRKLILPSKGILWKDIRQGSIPLLEDLRGYSQSLKRLVRKMIHPNPRKRPSASEILSHHITFSKNKENIKRLLNRIKTLQTKQAKELSSKKEEV